MRIPTTTRAAAGPYPTRWAWGWVEAGGIQVCRHAGGDAALRVELSGVRSLESDPYSDLCPFRRPLMGVGVAVILTDGSRLQLRCGHRDRALLKQVLVEAGRPSK